MSLKHQFKESRVISSVQLQELVHVVSHASKKPIDDNLPIVGHNIFCHESGIHTSAMIKNNCSYEPFEPDCVGLHREYPIGKHSGSAAISYHLKSLGIDADKEKIQLLLPNLRDIVTSRKQVLELEELRELYLCS
jgi:homocitrate synthase NifV